MKSALHISEVSAARFESAVRSALSLLTTGSERFSVSDIVRNARYPDGSPVGMNTIYAKNTNNEYVHAKLLSDLKIASAKSKKKRSVKSAGETKDEKPSLSDRVELSALGRQLIEQESHIRELEGALASMGHRLQRSQQETYVALVALSHLVEGGVLEVVRPLKELERTIGDLATQTRLRANGESLGQKCARLSRSY